ncbi:MAG: stage II sporulation protein M [Akkermansiaceae bacterium]|jgi:uncharacterized membrane protein SpoIIM required for sporulation
MNRQQFENKNTPEWQQFELKLKAAETRNQTMGGNELPSRFRRICYDLSLAQYRMFGHRIVDHLNGLAIRGYRLIHRKRSPFGEGAIRFVSSTFPRAFRKEWKLFVVVSMVFWLPFLAMWWSADEEMEWVEALLGPEQMGSLDMMYGKDTDPNEAVRTEEGSNFLMFSHYIWNNIGIDFRVFAGGIIYGVGSLFFLVYNGLYFGAAVGYVGYSGNPETFWRFVAGHSSFELLGMLVVGMAGLKIGFALLAPGSLSRGDALKRAGRHGVPLLIGGALMTFLAAVVEGFWSAEPFSATVKYSVGISFWVLHAVYFLMAGRRFGGA